MKKLMIIGLLLFFISCQKDNTTDDNPNTTGLLKDNLIISNGIERAYHLFLPENPINKPLVILLHGNGSSFDDIIGENNIKSPHKVWLSVASQNDFIVVIPNGTLGSNNKRGWNDCRTDAPNNPNTNDVLFITDLLDSIKNDYDFDINKVYVAGTSNGGHMAYRLAQEIPNRITAFASIAAAMPENSECSNSTIPISALFMNGTSDPFMPYTGGEMTSNRGTVLSTEQSVNYWVTRNGTTTSPISQMMLDINIMDDCTTTKFLYQNGTNNTEVALYKITDGGHTEPSIQERYNNIFLAFVGTQNGDFEMAEEIWNFFKTKSN